MNHLALSIHHLSQIIEGFQKIMKFYFVNQDLQGFLPFNVYLVFFNLFAIEVNLPLIPEQWSRKGALVLTVEIVFKLLNTTLYNRFFF